jgi:hypothetical protein
MNRPGIFSAREFQVVEASPLLRRSFVKGSRGTSEPIVFDARAMDRELRTQRPGHCSINSHLHHLPIRPFAQTPLKVEKP